MVLLQLCSACPLRLAALATSPASAGEDEFRPSGAWRPGMAALRRGANTIAENACYMRTMTTKISKVRQTTLVPVTTMEEVPVLGAAEREELVRSLEMAEAEIRRGDAVDHDAAAFKQRLADIHKNRG